MVMLYIHAIHPCYTYLLIIMYNISVPSSALMHLCAKCVFVLYVTFVSFMIFVTFHTFG